MIEVCMIRLMLLILLILLMLLMVRRRLWCNRSLARRRPSRQSSCRIIFVRMTAA
jgi:hypothetical protein